jgi:hypothetical protein
MLKDIPIEIILKICKYLDINTFTNFIKNNSYLSQHKLVKKKLEERKKLNAAKVICKYWSIYKINNLTLREFLQEF